MNWECVISKNEMFYPEIFALVSYIAIGARSAENQQHCFVSSRIDVPAGMKNTSGNLNVLFKGMYAA
ncbi:3-deoxy-7-phosphoheptulonate synthase [Streptococcus troglodytae]|uniref:3-deoxy-7-phosphoheptulonate synthase n=1 Tax=Streptococcus troglodytae TaxID=1111760 RepID=A0A1L7LLP3_9STRE|nr:3-deoxy-7-phosphoheptulonate synthase [Streptococcus troglodytae]